MSETRYSHSMSTEELFNLLLYQVNQFELFKNFVIEILDSRDIIKHDDFQQLFDEYKKMNKTKFLHNLIVLNRKLEDMELNISLL